MHKQYIKAYLTLSDFAVCYLLFSLSLDIKQFGYLLVAVKGYKTKG